MSKYTEPKGYITKEMQKILDKGKSEKSKTGKSATKKTTVKKSK